MTSYWVLTKGGEFAGYSESAIDEIDPGEDLTGYDAPVRVTRPPAANEVWDGADGWTENLPKLRDLRWGEAKAYRDAKAVAGCATPLGRVQTDEASCLKINGAVTAAMVSQAAGQPFSIDWTMEDNSVVTHSGAELIAMGMTVVAFMNGCQQAGTAIRTAIDNAGTAEAIAAIDIEAGYPED